MSRHYTAWEYEVFESFASGNDVAVTVDLETRFLFVVPLAEVSEVGEWEKEREGEETVGRQGGVVVSLAILSRVCPARLREMSSLP